jgi:hypothetical protein
MMSVGSSPRTPRHDSLTPDVTSTFVRLNARAWGIAFGLLAGFGLLFATWILVLRGGPNIGAHLGLLSNFFPGYAVTWGGGLIGFVYGFVSGYIFGRTVGYVYNRFVPVG